MKKSRYDIEKSKKDKTFEDWKPVDKGDYFDIEKEEEYTLFQAMIEAQKAFYKVFEDNNYDSAFFGIELIGTIKDVEFRPMTRIILKDCDGSETDLPLPNKKGMATIQKGLDSVN